MKQLRYSMTARCLAVFFAILFGFLTIAGSLTILFTYEMKLYTEPLDNVISDQFENLQKFYSVKIFQNKKNNPDCLKDSNLEYGIIKSNSVEDLFLQDMSIYSYQNFDTTVPEKDSYIISLNEGIVECSNENPTLLESLVQHYDYYINDISHTEYQESIIDLAYNTDNGVFYYETPRHSFPVYQITLDSVYASLNQSAPKTGKQKKNSSLEADAPSFTLNEKTLQYESDSGLYEPLDTSQYKNWLKFSTEESYWFYPSDIKPRTSKTLSSVITDIKTWLSPNDSFQTTGIIYPNINYDVAVNYSGEIYWIVSNIKNPLDTGAKDLFIQQKRLLTFLHNFRNPCIASTIGSFCLFLLLLAFCCYSAGYKKNGTTASVFWWHKIPLSLYIVGILVCIGSLEYFTMCRLRNILWGTALGTTLLLCSLSTIAAILIFVLAAMNLCRRHRAGILWKYTLCHYTGTLLKRGYQFYRQNTSLFWKGLFVLGGITLLETFLLILIAASETGIFLWILLKILEIAAGFIILLQMRQLQKESRMLAEGNLDSKLDTSHMLWELKKHGDYLNRIGDGMSIALEERLKSEHFKTELITNVSHDIKTPLTSIINYVDLLQKENITSETAKEYLEILERQSARLKKLIEDLMEASKASTGNLTVNAEQCDISILLTQTAGEFEEKLSANQLELITQTPDSSIIIQADNRHLWRIFDNLMNNICKYAQPGTRVYINWETEGQEVRIIFRNTSRYALNISGEDLMERFVRGDVSRNTEGNGLGLSIAQSLAELMGGTLKIHTDGDLFKVVLTFPYNS